MNQPRRPAGVPISSRRWRLHLARHVPVAVEGRDDEGVHQVRVAAGRLAVWLELGGRAVLRDDLRTLRREAAAVRDCDVLLGRRIPAAFAERLRARREAARTTMVTHLLSRHTAALRAALAVLPSLDRAAAEESLAAFRARVLERGDRLAAHAAKAPPEDEDFHAVRRAVRKLRYASEWLGRDTAEIRGVQRVFGDLNDRAVEARLLQETGAAPLCLSHAQRLESRLAAARRRALGVWTRARPRIAGVRA